MKKRSIILLLFFVLLLTPILHNGQTLQSTVFASSKNTEIPYDIIKTYTDKWAVIPKVDNGPKIDGKLDDVAWQNIDGLSNFVTAYYNEPDKSNIEAKLAYDRESLYIALEYPVDHDDDSLANFHILISPNADGEKYFCAPIKIKDLETPYVNNWGPNIQVLNNMQAIVSENEKSITAEVAIPLRELGIDEVGLGDEWRLNIIAQYEMGTKPLSAWIPIRTSSMHYTGGNASNAYANVTDEGRLGSIFMGQLPADGNSVKTIVPWEPQELTFEYRSFTEKELSFKRFDMNPKKTDIHLSWKALSEDWQPIENFKVKKDKERLNITFEHPKPLYNGLYQLQLVIDRENKNQIRSFIITFDRHSLIHAGEKLYSNLNSETGSKKSITPAPPSKEVEELLELIPEKTGFNFIGIPDQPHLKPAPNNFTWSAKNPHVLISRHGDKLTYPNDEYPEDKTLIVKNRKGEEVEYPYYEDTEGRRYFLTAHIWYRQKDYVLRQLESVAKSDPLGAARLLYRFAQVYEGYVPTNDHLWQSQPIDPSTGPPYHWWGGVWYRWAAAELFNFRYLADAYNIVNRTNAFEVLSQEVGENVEDKIIKEMFEPSIEFYRTFPILYHNMEYRNAEGLISLGRALNDPSYIHEAMEWAENFAMETYLFDGFFKETTISYHNQSTDGINSVIDALKGWTDPRGYISPRSGVRLDDLDMRERYPALKKSHEIPNLLVYPNGNYLPIQDTWAAEKSTTPKLDVGALLFPASGIARLTRGIGNLDDSQLYLTFQPKYGHHHYDPLNLILFAEGQELLPDIGYTHTLYRQWTNSTLAHNTVVVDSSDAEVSDKSKHGGNIDVFAPFHSDIQVMRARQNTAYSQANEYSREPWFIKFPDAENNEGYILDLFRVSGGNRHEYTLQGDANHDATFETDIPLIEYGPYLLPEGVEVREPEIETDKGSAEGHYYGYIYVRDVKQAENLEDQYNLTLVTEEKGKEKAKMNIIGLLEPGQNQLFIGESPSLRATRLEGSSKDNNDEAVKYMMPKMVLRREGENLTSNFITAMEPYSSEGVPRIDNIERLTPDQAVEGDIAVKVTYGNITDIILSSLAPDQPLVIGDMILKGKMGMIRLKDGEVEELYLVGGTSLKKGDIEVTGEGAISGSITEVQRQAEGASRDAFITETPISTDIQGKTLVITHPDGKTHGYIVKEVKEEDGRTIIEIDDMDPGFTINRDGTSELKFYPFTKWTGETVFTIENVVRLSED